jgi:hypothetical protein
MIPELSASFANSSGAKSTSPFNVQSGGGKGLVLVVVAATVVAVVALFLFLRK